jgi:hypothetical protein
MRRTAILLLALLVAASPAAARKLPRSYLTMAGGAKVYTADVSGDVMNERAAGHIELGVGVQLADPLLIEFSYGWDGTFIQEPPIGTLPFAPPPADTERAFQVGLNTIFMRLRYSQSGMRTEYLKPEFTLGVGWVQVTRFLRNYPAYPYEETSQMLASGELGAGALVVFSKNFSGMVGARFTLTERRGVVDDTEHLDGFSFLIGFRTFLPSPRDVAEP